MCSIRVLFHADDELHGGVAERHRGIRESSV